MIEQDQKIKLEAIRTIVKEEIRPFEDRIRKDFHERMDRILDSNDKLSVKLDKILAELPVTNHRIDSLDKRIANLEVSPSHA